MDAPAPAAGLLLYSSGKLRRRQPPPQSTSSLAPARLVRGHLFLLDLVVNDVPAGQLLPDLLQGDARLDHQHHHMVGQVGDLIHRLPVILGLGGDDDLSTLLPHLFQDLVQPLFKQVGGIRALGPLIPALLQQAVQALIAELLLHLTYLLSDRSNSRRSRSRSPDGRPDRPSSPLPAGRHGHSPPAAPRYAGNFRWSPL